MLAMKVRQTGVTIPERTLPELYGRWIATLERPTARVYVAGLHRAARAVGRSAHEIDWRALDPAILQHMLIELTAQGYSPSAVNLSRAAVFSMVRHLWRDGLVDNERRARLEDVPGVKGTRLPSGRHVDAQELVALAKACAAGHSLVGLRDVALIALGATAGLRRSELVALDLADVQTETGRVVVRRGKGNKERATFVSNGALDALRDWIDARGAEPGPLFVRLVREKGGTHAVTKERLSVQTVVDILKRRALAAGVERIRPHDLRRTVAGELLDSGADISTVARLLGHASVQTTQRYDRRGEHAVAAAVAKVRFPYRRGTARGLE